MIRAHKYFMMFIFLWTAVFPPIVYAVAPYPFEEPSQEGPEAVATAGASICLFESGTVDVKQMIKTNDVLIVFRKNPDQTFKEVGKVKVLSYSGKNFIRAQVIEGELKANDIAKKGDAASLVISSEVDCK